MLKTFTATRAAVLFECRNEIDKEFSEFCFDRTGCLGDFVMRKPVLRKTSGEIRDARECAHAKA